MIPLALLNEAKRHINQAQKKKKKDRIHTWGKKHFDPGPLIMHQGAFSQTETQTPPPQKNPSIFPLWQLLNPLATGHITT